MTQRDATSHYSFPLSRITPLKAMASTGSWWEDHRTLVRAGEPRDRPACLRKHLRSQKEKQSIAERLSLGFTLVPRKSPLGYYLGRLVPSKTCSFRQSLPMEASLGVACQPVVCSPNTIASHRASAGAWLASAALKTGRAMDHTQLRGSRILLPPTKPALRVRPISLPMAGPFEPTLPAAWEPKPTSRHKLAVVKPAVNARRARLAEWQAAKGKVLKRPPSVMIPDLPKRCLSKKPPVLSSWTTITDEEETRSELDQASLAVPEEPSQAGRGARREEAVAPWDPATQGAQDSVEYWVHLQLPAGASGNTCLAGKRPQHLADEQCGSARAVDNGKRLLYASTLQISVWKRVPKLSHSDPHPSSLAAE
ncbi:cytoskeleton-associated protein 2-like [Gopherus flavomarginatus]|uniref:cytoskeleton-associated protein 2-like n=1 Tax=Gopherus flavomarginatus TaxID=286002 RepID=UPI0021CBA4F7|nr:cytoskeleton-associated protein 2-like [Gopherus flavomarginatus]